MKKYIFVGLYFIYILVLSQNNDVKLLFDITGDLRNPSFFIPSGYLNNNSLLFEVHQDSSSNIFISDYIPEHKSFSAPYPITVGQSIYRNPIGFANSHNKIVFFQMNINRSWDIVYKECVESVWGNLKTIADSIKDHVEISLVKYDEFYTLDFPSIVYNKNNSIYLFTKRDVDETTELVLESKENIKYSSPVGLYSDIGWSNWKPRIFNVAAIQTDNENKKKILLLEKNLISNNISTSIIDSGDIKNPQFSRKNYSYILTYEKIVDGHSTIYYYDKDARTTDSISLSDTLNGDFYNLKTEDSPRPLIDIFKKSRFESFIPYTFNFFTDNRWGISINNMSTDTLISTRMINPSASVELIGNYDREVNYAVWEDSSDNGVKLFALKLKSSMPDDVITRIFPQEYNLSQNYPNPFNPSTTINYQIPVAGYVSLKIYDLLGREIATLVDGEKSPGYYKATFDGSNLASGVYLYRLQSGAFIAMKKFVLIK